FKGIAQRPDHRVAWPQYGNRSAVSQRGEGTAESLQLHRACGSRHVEAVHQKRHVRTQPQRVDARSRECQARRNHSATLRGGSKIEKETEHQRVRSAWVTACRAVTMSFAIGASGTATTPRNSPTSSTWGSPAAASSLEPRNIAPTSASRIAHTEAAQRIVPT